VLIFSIVLQLEAPKAQSWLLEVLGVACRVHDTQKKKCCPELWSSSFYVDGGTYGASTLVRPSV
jgi:hypothetical protein